jgi:hypothetical protein
MKHSGEADDPRRRLLVRALAAGFFSTGMSGAWAQFFGNKPERLPPGRSIYRISGQASVNGTPATPDTRIVPGDTVETGKDSEIIFVVNSQSMILRADSRLVLQSESKSLGSALVTGLRLVTGKILSVSRNQPMRIQTVTATIGIRGTGWYAEADPEQTYFCTCYGVADVASATDPASSQTVAATHHDMPLYIVANGTPGNNVRRAPFINHTDQELALIETLVGRTPPFVFSNDIYNAPRRDY